MRNINFDKKLFLKIILFILSLMAVLCLILFLLYLWAIKSGSIPPPTKYVRGDINDVVYAEPTQEAKNFDIEGHINSLPSVEYEKIDYPVKETYTYEFNDYVLTVDVPEGFEAHEIKLTSKPRVIDSKGIEDSCIRYNFRDVCSGSWLSNEIMSDSSLCILGSNANKKQKNSCDGIELNPKKSIFKGISLRDYFVRIIVKNYNKKIVTKNFISFLLYKDRHLIAKSLLSDNQIFSVVPGEYMNQPDFSKDLYFSIIDSIKIQKK